MDGTMDADTDALFGVLLKDYRLRAGLTQEALAERAGVSVRGIQNLERGGHRPLRDTLTRLTTALELDGQERVRFLSGATPLPRRRGGSAATGATALARPGALPTPPTALVGRTRCPRHPPRWWAARARAPRWTPCCVAMICAC